MKRDGGGGQKTRSRNKEKSGNLHRSEGQAKKTKGKNLFNIVSIFFSYFDSLVFCIDTQIRRIALC